MCLIWHESRQDAKLRKYSETFLRLALFLHLKIRIRLALDSFILAHRVHRVQRDEQINKQSRNGKKE